MATALRQFFDQISATVISSSEQNRLPARRRSSRSNVDQDEFRCYSVCVARLAIMLRNKLKTKLFRLTDSYP